MQKTQKDDHSRAAAGAGSDRLFARKAAGGV